MIAQGASLICEDNSTIELADNVVVGLNVEIISTGQISFDRGSSIGAYTFIGPREPDCSGKLVTGQNCHVSDHNILDLSGDITFGDEVRTGHFDILHTHNHTFEQDALIWNQPIKVGSVQVGSGTWIGSSVNIMPDVVLGHDVVVAAGAVVTQSFPDGHVVGGVPARTLRIRRESTFEKEGKAHSNVAP